jgi:hypothetical protein
MIREQKQCSSSPAWRASRQYKIYSDNAGRRDLFPARQKWDKLARQRRVGRELTAFSGREA